MTFIKKVGAIIAIAMLSVTASSAFSLGDFNSGFGEDDNIISEYEIKNATTIDEGVKVILQSVHDYGLEEYNKQVEDGEEQPYFWLAKPLNLKADNVVDMFAPDFTKGVKMGGCFEVGFHHYMQAGESVEDATKHAKEDIPECMKNGEDGLGEFASTVRQMVLCQPKHGQIFLDSDDSLFFAAAMPCHVSIYKKGDKIYVSWRNVEKMAELAELDKDKQDLAEEVQDAMEDMLGDL